jgi:ribosomal protein L21E
MWDRRDSHLKPAQRLEKQKGLRALSLVRTGKVSDLAEAFKQQGLDPLKAFRKTTAVNLRRGKLAPKTSDKIPRSMKIYEEGKLVHVEVASSETASSIGHYWNTIGDLIETGKSSSLRKFQQRKFKDIRGHYHTFERNPKVILKLEERKPKPEVFEIYKR